MNWLERARYEIRESGSRPTANTAEGNPTAAMAVPDPVICADSQACAHNLEDQTSQRAHREIQKSMQTPTANTAERSPTAVMAVSHPVICADSAACAGSGGAIPAEVPEFRPVPEEFAGVELRFDGDDLLETSTPPADAVLDLLLRHKVPSLLGPNLDGWTAEDWQAFFDERAGIVEHDGGFPRPDAEMSAFEDCVDHRLALHPPVAGEYGYCLHCGTPASDRDRASMVVTCVGGTTGRLHANCASDWKNRRRWEARTALIWLLHRTRTMEIERTAGGG